MLTECEKLIICKFRKISVRGLEALSVLIKRKRWGQGNPDVIKRNLLKIGFRFFNLLISFLLFLVHHVVICMYTWKHKSVFIYIYLRALLNISLCLSLFDSLSLMFSFSCLLFSLSLCFFFSPGGQPFFKNICACTCDASIWNAPGDR